MCQEVDDEHVLQFMKIVPKKGQIKVAIHKFWPFNLTFHKFNFFDSVPNG